MVHLHQWYPTFIRTAYMIGRGGMSPEPYRRSCMPIFYEHMYRELSLASLAPTPGDE